MTPQVGSQAVAVSSPGKSMAAAAWKGRGEWEWQLLTLRTALPRIRVIQHSGPSAEDKVGALKLQKLTMQEWTKVKLHA